MWKSQDAGFLSLNEISQQCSIPLSMITVGKLWDKAQLATDVPDKVPTAEDFGTCLAQAKRKTPILRLES